jgi:hypothetical protein
VWSVIDVHATTFRINQAGPAELWWLNGPFHHVSAVAPRFVHKSVHNLAAGLSSPDHLLGHTSDRRIAALVLPPGLSAAVDPRRLGKARAI